MSGHTTHNGHIGYVTVISSFSAFEHLLHHMNVRELTPKMALQPKHCVRCTHTNAAPLILRQAGAASYMSRTSRPFLGDPGCVIHGTTAGSAVRKKGGVGV